MAKIKQLTDLEVVGKVTVTDIPNNTGDILTVSGVDGKTISRRTNAEFIADLSLGSVKSVAMTVPLGLTVTGSPITSTGTLAVSLATGYSIPTTAKQTQWDTAYTYSTVGHLPLTGGNLSGSLTINTDNTLFTVGNNRDIGFVKKNGFSGALGIGLNNSFRITRSNNTAISVTDTFTDLLTISGAGNATFLGSVTANSFIGNASTATKLETPRSINGVNFDGSSNITINDATKLPLAGGTMSGTITFNNNQSGTPQYPSLGNGFRWNLSSDGAGMYVQERGGDSIDYLFWMSDNIASGDRYVWQMREHRGNYMRYDAMELYPGASLQVRNLVQVYGGIVIQNPSLSEIFLDDIDPAKPAQKTTIVRNNSTFFNPNLNGSTLVMSVDLTQMVETSIKGYLIKIVSGGTTGVNTFCWGQGLSAGLDHTVSTSWTGYDIPVSTDYITLENGVRIKFNVLNGGVAGESFGFTVTPGGGFKSNTRFNSYFSGALAVGKSTVNANLKLDVLGNSNFSGTITTDNTISAPIIGINSATPTTGNGLSLWNGPVVGLPTYGISFSGTPSFGTHGAVTGTHATYFVVNQDSTRGWIFKGGQGASGNVASISGAGLATFNSDVVSLGNIKSNTAWLRGSNTNGLILSDNGSANVIYFRPISDSSLVGQMYLEGTGRLVSTAAQGTAPFFITSKTLVSNLNAELLNSFTLNTTDGSAWGYVPSVRTDGTMNIGRYIDFTHTSASGVDFAARIQTDGTSNNKLFIANNGEILTTLSGYTKTETDNKYLPLAGGSLTGGLIISGTTPSGGTNMGGFRNEGVNITLEGDSAGRSGIFFKSNKLTTNVNHPSDYGFIQYHAQGVDRLDNEVNRLIIGVANDTSDKLVLQTSHVNGVVISYQDASAGTLMPEYVVYHTGNFNNLTQLTTRNFADLQNKPTTIDGYGITDQLSRLVATTTNGTSTDNNTWTKIATINLGSGTQTDANLVLTIVSTQGDWGSTTIDVGVRQYLEDQTPALLVNILSSGKNALNDDAFKLVSDGFNTPTVLYVKKSIAYGTYRVFEIASFKQTGVTVTYHSTQGWSATEPTGTFSYRSSGLKYNGQNVWHAGNFTNLNQLTTRNFSDLQNIPTTISGYGITDAFSQTLADDRYLKLTGGTVSGVTTIEVNDPVPLILKRPNQVGIGFNVSNITRYLGVGVDGDLMFGTSNNHGVNYNVYHSGNLTNLSQLTTRNFADLQNKPTTLAGYGITDAKSGTVTSIAMTVPTGLSVTGSPITTSGTLALTLTSGYSIPTTTSQAQWDAAYNRAIATNLGAVTSLPINSTAITAQAFSDLPVGYGGFILGNGNPVAPSANYGYFTKVAQRDTGGGWGGMWIDHTGTASINAYLGRTINDTRTIGWVKIWTEQNFTNLNQLTTRNFSDLQSKPTTLAGYGITDAFSQTLADDRYLKLTGGSLSGALSSTSTARFGSAGFSSQINTIQAYKHSTGEDSWVVAVKATATSTGDMSGIKLHTGYSGEVYKWAGIAAVAESSASNTTGLALYAGQNERVRITNSGYVGIGTSTPTSPLEIVSGPSASMLALRTTNGALNEQIGINFGSKVVVGYDGVLQGLGLSVSDNTKPIVFSNLLGQGTGEFARFTGAGWLGIGTINPTTTVDVVGTGRFSGNLTARVFESTQPIPASEALAATNEWVSGIYVSDANGHAFGTTNGWDTNMQTIATFKRSAGRGFQLSSNGESNIFKIRSLHTTNESTWRTLWHSGNLNNINQLTTRNFSDLQNKPTTISGYGITDSYTKTEINSSLVLKADLVDGVIPAYQLPSYVDDVLEFDNQASFPVIGESGKLYIAIDSNLVYRWSGTTYAVTTSSLALGETASTAYRGDYGKIAYDHSQITSGNPHGTTFNSLVGIPASFTPSAHTLDSHSNVTITSVSNGEILKYNGTQWVNNTLAEAGVEGTISVGTTSQYMRGDKTWQTLNSSAVPEGTNLYFTGVRVLDSVLTGYVLGTNTAVSATSTVKGAIQQLQAQINARGGTVTSVEMTVPTGLTVTGAPITSSGTLALGLASGYSIPTTAKQANWDTAYGWGDHSNKYIKQSVGETVNLDTQYAAGQGYWGNTAVGRPDNYGTYLNLVNSSGTYNGSTNWLVQLMFSAEHNRIFYRNKTNAGAWAPTVQLYHSGNLRSDTLNDERYLKLSGGTMTSSINHVSNSARVILSSNRTDETLTASFGYTGNGSYYITTVANRGLSIGTTTATEALNVVGNGTFTGNVTAVSFIGDLTGNATTATTLLNGRTIWGKTFDGSADVSGLLKITSTDQSTSRIQLINTATAGRQYDIISGVHNKFQTGFSIHDVTAGVTRLTINAAGNVGIGNTSPSSMLDVEGTGSFSDTVTGKAFLSTQTIPTTEATTAGNNWANGIYVSDANDHTFGTTNGWDGGMQTVGTFRFHINRGFQISANTASTIFKIRSLHTSELSTWRVLWHSGNFNPAQYSSSDHTHTFASITAKPTTLEGYGITGGNLSGSLNVGGALTANRIENTILDLHPESNTVILPYISNDIAYLTKRGGTVTTNMPSLTQTVINAWFDGTPSYGSLPTTIPTEGLIIEVAFHRTFSWTTRAGINFGAAQWRANKIKLEVYEVATSTWVTKFDLTNNTEGFKWASVGSNTGISKMRWTLNDFTAGGGGRIAQIWVLGYNSLLSKETLVGRDGGDIYGSLNLTGTTTASQLISTVGTGTAPFTVTSTTVVNNLNADMLDNHHLNTVTSNFDWAARGVIPRVGNDGVMDIGKYLDFHAASGASGDYSVRLISNANGQLDISGYVNAPKFISSIAQGTAPFQITSTTLVSNLNVDMVDGYHVGGLTSGSAWGFIPAVRSDGSMDIGRYIDFTHTSASGIDFATRIQTDGSSNNKLFIANNGEILTTGTAYTKTETDNKYLPLAGGAMTGGISGEYFRGGKVYANKVTINRPVNDAVKYVKIFSGSSGANVYSLIDFYVQGSYNNSQFVGSFKTVLPLYNMDSEIIVEPFHRYNGSIVSSIIVGAISNLVNEVWLEITAVNATQPGSIDIYCSRADVGYTGLVTQSTFPVFDETRIRSNKTLTIDSGNSSSYQTAFASFTKGVRIGVAGYSANALHVGGTVRFDNTLTMNSFIGGGSQLIKADNNGVLVTGTLAIADIPELPWSKITSGKPTTIAGYGITDAVSLTLGQSISAQHNFNASGSSVLTWGGHTYHNMYDAAGNVFKHYYPAGGFGNVVTIANFRVWNGSASYKTLKFSGDGGFTWDNNTVFHSGNLINLNQLTTRNFSDLQNKPTTLAGYGITDAFSQTIADDRYLKLSGGTLSGGLTSNSSINTTSTMRIGAAGFSSNQNTLQVHDFASATTGGWTIAAKSTAIAVGDITGLKLHGGYSGETGKWAGIAAVAESSASNTTALALYSGQTERVRISHGGNLGIGTTSPGSPLTVVAASSASMMSLQSTGALVSESAGILLQGRATVAYDGTSNGLTFSTADNGKPIVFSNSITLGSGEYARFTGAGSLGLGTVTPSGKFHVVGNATFGLANSGNRTANGVSIMTSNDNSSSYIPTDANRAFHIENVNTTTNASVAMSMRVDNGGTGAWVDFVFKKTASAEGTLSLLFQNTEQHSFAKDGTFTATGIIKSNTGWLRGSATSGVILSDNSAANMIYLRPISDTSASGQVTINGSGTITTTTTGTSVNWYEAYTSRIQSKVVSKGSIDYNSVIETGFFRMTGGANGPNGTAHTTIMNVTQADNAYGGQIAFVGNLLMTRSIQAADSWTPWITLLTNANFTNLNQLTTRNFSDLQNKPTTLAGYGITDAKSGTVTSVGMTVPTGLTVTGSPITTSGTLAITLTSGYSIPTTTVQAQWTAAYNRAIATNLGAVTSLAINNTTNSDQAFSDLPVGYGGFIQGNGNPVAPTVNYGYFTKFAQRDVFGGWGGMWIDHNSGVTNTYIGRTIDNDKSISWSKIWTDKNFTNLNQLTTRDFSDLQNIPTTAAGYGITDVYTKDQLDSDFVTVNTEQAVTGAKVFTQNINEVGVIKGCLGWWKLENDTYDYVNKLDGVATNVTYDNGSVKFTSATSKVVIPNNVLLTPSEITVSCMVKVTQALNERQIFVAKWQGFSCEIGVDMMPFFQISTPTSVVSPKGPPMVIDTWYHFVGTYDTVSGCSLYINGELIGSTPNVDPMSSSTSDLIFGQYTGTVKLTGCLRDVRIFDRVLSQKEINILFKFKG